jgi:hypothetical protein
MVRRSRRRLPLTSLDSNTTEPHRRSKRQKTRGKESDSGDEGVLVEGENPAMEVEVASKEVGDIATRTEEATMTEEANDDAEAEVDNELPPASSNEEEDGENPAMEVEAASEEVGDYVATRTEEATTTEEANKNAEAEVDNEPPRASSDEEEDLSDDTPQLPTDINLRCMKQVDKYVPKQRGKGKMQPPPTFRTDIALCFEWRGMTSDEQKAAKAEYTGKAAPVKKSLKLLIPGSDCVCCRRKTRNDRGQTRGAQNQSSDQQLDRAAPPEPPPAAAATQQEAQEMGGEAYASLGSSEAMRHNVLPPVKAPYRRTSAKKLEHARSVQGQGGIQALKAIRSANRSFARAVTACTVTPKLDANSNNYIYADPSKLPRVSGLQIWVNEVQETPMSGGKLPPAQLRRAKTEITYISSCKEDAERIFKILTGDSNSNRDNYIKVKYFGTGERLMDLLNASDQESKRRRSKPDAAANIEQSQNAIPLSIAPSSEYQEV